MADIFAGLLGALAMPGATIGVRVIRCRCRPESSWPCMCESVRAVVPVKVTVAEALKLLDEPARAPGKETA